MTKDEPPEVSCRSVERALGSVRAVHEQRAEEYLKFQGPRLGPHAQVAKAASKAFPNVEATVSYRDGRATLSVAPVLPDLSELGQGPFPDPGSSGNMSHSQLERALDACRKMPASGPWPTCEELEAFTDGYAEGYAAGTLGSKVGSSGA